MYITTWSLSVEVDSSSYFACLNFNIFNGPKRNQTSHSWFRDSGANKPLLLVDQAAKYKYESKFEALPVIWPSLPKEIQEGNRRFWLQNQWQSSWGSAPAHWAQLRWVGRASTNAGRFLVGCSRCGLQQARFKEMRYHSCDTDLVQKGFNALQIWAATKVGLFVFFQK